MKLFVPFLLVFLLLGVIMIQAAPLRVAAFTCDATPPLGEPMIWATPLTSVVLPLQAKGVVIEDGTNRFVLCAFDWCLIGDASELKFRETLASAAGTPASRVSVHSLHQHAAPYADEDAHRLLDAATNPPPHLSTKYLDELRGHLAESVAGAVQRLEVFDNIGTGQARVERVASARRIHDASGKLLTRFSTSGSDKIMAAAPEGDIDPMLKTITFARGERALARLHFYATHPQTFCCDGRASSDFVGDAREDLEREEHVPEIYFTGCAGDVTVGKYNDGSAEAYAGLKKRLGAGLRAAIAATHFQKALAIHWRTESLILPLRDDHEKSLAQSRAWLNDPRKSDDLRVYRGAMRLAFADRLDRPIELSSLELGGNWIVNLPGEPMLEFQRLAQKLRPDEFVAVAAYGDSAPAYICTEEAIREGGYEPTASNVGLDSERTMFKAIERLLAFDPAAGKGKPGLN
jgi:hypothetical protein